MTDTADQTAPAARDDQPQAPEDLLAEPLEMPAPGPAPGSPSPASSATPTGDSA